MLRFVFIARKYDKGLMTREQIEAIVNDELTSQESFEKIMDDNKNMPPTVKVMQRRKEKTLVCRTLCPTASLF